MFFQDAENGIDDELDAGFNVSKLSNTSLADESSVNKVVVTIGRCKKSPEGRRIYDSKHTCLFCQKEFVKICRHYSTVHKNESEVNECRGLPRKKKDEAFDLLRLKGDYYHNLHVMS